MITQRWKPSGARSSARPWRKVTSGPRTGSDGSYSNSSRLFITGAGSTALWGINHLWTSNKQTTNNERSRLKYCDHKKGGREECSCGSSAFRYEKVGEKYHLLCQGCRTRYEKRREEVSVFENG